MCWIKLNTLRYEQITIMYGLNKGTIYILLTWWLFLADPCNEKGNGKLSDDLEVEIA